MCCPMGATGQGQLHGNFAATPRQVGNDRLDWSRFGVNPVAGQRCTRSSDPPDTALFRQVAQNATGRPERRPVQQIELFDQQE